MTEIKPKLEYTVNTSETGIPAIIVAAGNSSRMNGINKQFLPLCSIPVIIRTLLAFERCAAVSGIILAARDSDIEKLQLLTQKYGISKLGDIVCGGNTRQESVLKGFERLSSGTREVLIHDGARPLVDSGIITSVTQALKNHTAVTCAVKVKDTVKQIDESGKVIKTLRRDNLVLVQTPQGVKTDEYRLAAEKAGDLSQFTDDASLMEAAGYEVYTVEGSYRNIKITTPEDIAAAESYISSAEQ